MESTNAINAPVRRAPKEQYSSDTPITQKPNIVMNDDGSTTEQVIQTLEAPLIDDYAQLLAFNEEPLTIMVQARQEKNPANVIDCWVNGEGAEVFLNGRWTSMNCLPVNMPVVTKRKYVEVLLRSKVDTISTVHDDANVERPSNQLVRVTTSNCVLSIMSDKNPNGGEWLRQMMRQAG